MKKRIISVLLCAAMVGTLAAGCGSKEAGSDDGKKDKKEGKEITFMARTGQIQEMSFWRNLQKKTGISVVFNEVSWDDIRDKVSIAASGGKRQLM